MSWWQRMCINIGISFFQALCQAEPKVKEESKKYALQIFRYIRLAYQGDPDFE